MQTIELYIDGAFAAPKAGGSLQAINPATETVFARIARIAAGTEGFMGFREIKKITRYDNTRTWSWYLRP